MSPAEGALYFGIPNIYMNQANAGAEAKLGRFDSPFEQYAVALRPFKRVLWGLVGSGGFTTAAERKEGLELIAKTPNFVGAHLDDFFTSETTGKPAVLTLDELREIRQTLKAAGRPLEIYSTYYTTLLKFPLDDYVKLLDGVTFWTWKPEDLVDLASNVAKVKEMAPHLKVILGCYLVDFTKKDVDPHLGHAAPVRVRPGGPQTKTHRGHDVPQQWCDGRRFRSGRLDARVDSAGRRHQALARIDVRSRCKEQQRTHKAAHAKSLLWVLVQRTKVQHLERSLRRSAPT